MAPIVRDGELLESKGFIFIDHFSFYLGTEKKLSDLERLARQEKIYCASQLKNGQAGAPSTKPSRNPDASNDLKSNKL